MGNAGLVLLADEEERFLQSVGQTFRDAGYACHAATTVDATLDQLREKPYDVLIASLSLPGNFGLRIVHEARQVAPDVPVILTAAEPSLETAIEAVGLSVTAYLPKPIKPDLLLRRIARIMQTRPPYRTLGRVIDELRRCVEELEEIRTRPGESIPLALSEMPLRRLSASLLELLKLREAGENRNTSKSLCEIIGCSQWPTHEAAFRDVIQVLQETKRRFKSKELAELRSRLDRHLGISEE